MRCSTHASGLPVRCSTHIPAAPTWLTARRMLPRNMSTLALRSVM